MGFTSLIYNTVARRTSTFVLAVGVSAFAFERGFDTFSDWIWENNNKGKLWKDIKLKYEE